MIDGKITAIFNGLLKEIFLSVGTSGILNIKISNLVSIMKRQLLIVLVDIDTIFLNDIITANSSTDKNAKIREAISNLTAIS